MNEATDGDAILEPRGGDPAGLRSITRKRMSYKEMRHQIPDTWRIEPTNQPDVVA